MNHYPLWKYLLILFIVAAAALYALPNLYPNVPAVQISHESGELSDSTLGVVKDALSKKEIEIQAVEQQENKLLLRFSDDETQLKAKDLTVDALDGQHVVALNLAPATPGWLRGLGASPMNLGLDLRGGVHFLLEVDMEAAKEKAINNYVSSFRTSLREADQRRFSVSQNKEELSVKFRDEESSIAGLEALRKEYGNELVFDESNEGSNYFVTAKISEDAAKEIQTLAVQQNIQTLRNRVNELGVAEPVIQQQGAERIVVQLPGVQDTAQAKEILGATATVEFRMVDEQNDPYAAAESGRVPVGSVLYYERDSKNPILLKRSVMLTGDRIINANSGYDENGTPAAIITLDGQGASRFAKVTGENIKKLMAVVFIDNKSITVEKDGEKVKKTIRSEEVINVARIQEQLSKRFQIEGLDSTHEALKLSLLLRAGALAAPVEIVEERTVGPSLGKENIRVGKNSILIGMVLVMIFMLFYYKVFGLAAWLPT